MKTILYQPLFINPQAYFVFPQLYHIEKGDSYIEPANITGQLIINDLTQSLTSTPILNVVQDTNQVDFGLFKGKHIRISQYTNIGAVALGKWYIPGTPTPPEPEQPDWFKESIVAWYSPYCKQRMTNFDVIEAYTEDFTKWAYRNSRGTAKITNNTIVITNVVETNNIVEDDNEPYSDLTIRVTGVTENKYLIVRQGRGKPETHIKKDGVYTFKDNNLYFGFGVSVIGECNITIAQLPTSILKDFSGNSNHAYLYGGKGKLNSGMGVYKFDFLSDLLINSAYLPYTERQYDSNRTILDSQTGSYGFISKRQIPGIGGAFVLEKDENTGIPNAFRTFSFNTSTIIYPNKKQSIVYQTKTSYNGKDISFGITKDTDFLLIGAGLYNKNPNINAITEQMKITHGDILLFNRSLTEYEISWVKNNMMCSKQQEPDIDL